MADIQINDNITILNQNNEVECEMACFDIQEEDDKYVYYFQSVDKNGKMEVLEIPQNIFKLLNWRESPITRFVRFEQISDILENYHNMSQLEVKGFTGCFNDKTRIMDSVSLYLKNNSIYIEIICFGTLYPHVNDNYSYFMRNGETIPFIYIKETDKVMDLHLDKENKMFYLIPDDYSYKMKDISCWSGKDYTDKLVFSFRSNNFMTTAQAKNFITLDGFGVEFETVGNYSLNKPSYTDNMILIYGHHNYCCNKIFDNGILIDTDWYNKVSKFEFLSELKK